jgi:hypothetical protein
MNDRGKGRLAVAEQRNDNHGFMGSLLNPKAAVLVLVY